MTSRRWLRGLAAAAFFLTSGFALAQGNSDHHGHGRGHHKDHDDQGDQGDHDWHGRHYYSEHDRDDMRYWYREHDRDLPPGLAKRDRLPPGLERQLEARGTLPPGLRRDIEPCPRELVRELPPPPPHCEHVIIGGHIVLLNRANFQIIDVIHLELN